MGEKQYRRRKRGNPLLSLILLVIVLESLATIVLLLYPRLTGKEGETKESSLTEENSRGEAFPENGEGESDPLADEGKDSSEMIHIRTQGEGKGLAEDGASIVIHQETDEEEDDSGKGSEEASGPVRILFSGDVYFSDYVLESYQDADGIEGILSDGYRDEISSADFFVVNEEFPFSERGTPQPDKQYTFRISPEYGKIMKEMDADLAVLANNHVLDYGIDAMMDSIKTLDSLSILHIGAGKDLSDARKAAYVDIKGKTFAFLGATRVIPVPEWAAGSSSPGLFSAYDDGEMLAKDIMEAKKKADYVIVYLHWGIERAEKPNEVQKNLAETCVNAGADLVLGAHPHVLQGLEWIGGTPVAYSLGNFIFGSSIPRTALLEAVFTEGRDISLRLLPGKSSGGYTRMLSDEEDIREFCRYMESISPGISVSQDGSILPEP